MSPVVAELGGVVDHVEHGAVDGGRTARHQRIVGNDRDRPTGSATHAGSGLLAQAAELALLRRLVIAAVGGQIDEFVDQRRELFGFGVEIGHQLIAGNGIEILEPAQHGHIRAQARQRSAQLVAGVLHELLLLVSAARQRAEHAVHRRAEPAGLVCAADRDLDVEPAGQGDVVGRLGEAHEASGHLPTDQPADQRRTDDDEADRRAGFGCGSPPVPAPSPWPTGRSGRRPARRWGS